MRKYLVQIIFTDSKGKERFFEGTVGVIGILKSVYALTKYGNGKVWLSELTDNNQKPANLKRKGKR